MQASLCFLTYGSYNISCFLQEIFSEKEQSAGYAAFDLSSHYASSSHYDADTNLLEVLLLYTHNQQLSVSNVFRQGTQHSSMTPRLMAVLLICSSVHSQYAISK